MIGELKGRESLVITFHGGSWTPNSSVPFPSPHPPSLFGVVAPQEQTKVAVHKLLTVLGLVSDPHLPSKPRSLALQGCHSGGAAPGSSGILSAPGDALSSIATDLHFLPWRPTTTLFQKLKTQRDVTAMHVVGPVCER